MSKEIDNWIHGRMVIETGGADDKVLVQGPIQPDGYRRSIMIGMTPDEMKYLNYEIPRLGPQRNAIVRGAARALKMLGVVGGTALTIAGGAMLLGTAWQVAIPAAVLTATGSALAAGVQKTNKEINKQAGTDQVSNWKILAGIILEILKLIVALTRKDKK